MSDKYTHWAVKGLCKHSYRAMWGILVAYALIWVHPAPVSAKAIIILLAVAGLFFDIGVHLTSFLICKRERQRGKYE